MSKNQKPEDLIGAIITLGQKALNAESENDFIACCRITYRRNQSITHQGQQGVLLQTLAADAI
jgi:hypothetical protein